MLYNRNTNQTQTLVQQVQRGAAAPPPPPPPVTASFFDGLGRSVYLGFMGVDPNFFATATQTGSTIVNSGSLTTVLDPAIQTSTQWLGYFKPDETEVYTFHIRSDDTAVLYIGNAATASVLTTGSALLFTPITTTEISASIALVSGTMYPMRVQHSDGLGPQFFTSSWSSPTNAKTTDYTGYTFCNTASLGF